MIAWASRLFPEPLDPTTATISPLFISRSIFSTAWIVRLENPRSYWVKVTERSLTSKIVSFIFPASLLMNTARIQKSAEFLSDIMKQKHGPNEEKSREQRQPPFSHGQIFHAFRKDNSDGRTLGRQTKA